MMKKLMPLSLSSLFSFSKSIKSSLLKSNAANYAILIVVASTLTGCASTDHENLTYDQASNFALKNTIGHKNAVPPLTSSNINTAQTLRSMMELQKRLYRVAGPLLVRNIEFCKNSARPLFGFTAKNKYSYTPELIAEAERSLQLENRLQVTGVLPESGAAQAGLQTGDILLTVQGRPLPQGQNAERQTAILLAPLLKGMTAVKVDIERKNTAFTLNVPLTPACSFTIESGNTDIVNAYNDGRRILITRGMMTFAKSDEDLAYVLAKEISHNILGHARKQKNNAAMGGIIDNLAQVRPDMSTLNGTAGVQPFSQENDAAADRLSLYLLARAGYNPANALIFWQRLAAQYPGTVLNSYTAIHPATSYRLIELQKNLDILKTKQNNGQALRP